MTPTLTWSDLKKAALTLALDVHAGFVEITRHSLAVIGLAIVAMTLTLTARPGLQEKVSETMMGWLELRHVQQLAPIEALMLSPAARSTASPVQDLSRDQVAVTDWLSRKYKVSPEPLAALVSEAWALGERSQIAPTLILAVIAIESRFNPFASGNQGRMGLMQIEPEVHSNALTPFGGRLAAFDPLTNLRVGTRYLQELIHGADTLEDALRLYAQASGQGKNPHYIDRILAEQKLMDKVSNPDKVAKISKNSTQLPKLTQAQM